MRAPTARLGGAAARILLPLLVAARLAAQPSGTLPQIELAELRVEAAGVEAAGRLQEEILALWAKRYSRLVRLEQAGAAAESARIEVNAGQGGAVEVKVSLEGGGGSPREATATLQAPAPGAVAEAAAGELFFQWAGERRFRIPPQGQPPALSGVLSLQALSLLSGWSGKPAEPVCLAVSPRGLTLVFSDRLITLGADLEPDADTARELLFPLQPPEGFIPSYGALDPLGRPWLYSLQKRELLAAGPLEDPALFAVPSGRPLAAAAAPGGGLALLTDRGVELFRRRRQGLLGTALPLPHPYFGALAADGKLWVLDLKERRIRFLSLRGAEIGGVKPCLDPADLPFPQVLAPFPDGSFLLGGSGELWRFDQGGLPLWRLRLTGLDGAQALPAYFQAAAAGRSWYLLDLVEARVLRYREAAGPGEEAAGGKAGRSPLEELYPKLGSGERSPGELTSAAMQEGALLQAASLSAGRDNEALRQELGRRVRRRQAELLQGLAARSEEEGLLAEAEAACAAALELLRELRKADPADPRYPEQITETTQRRVRLRAVLTAEPAFTVSSQALQQGAPGGGEPGPQGAVALRLVNRLPRAVTDVQATGSYSGLPGSGFTAKLPDVPAGGSVELSPPPPAGPPQLAEQLPLALCLLLRYRGPDGPSAQYLRLPAVVPADLP